MNRRRPTQLLFILTALILWNSPAPAGNIVGTITESVGSTPLAGIDLDLFDSNFTSVAVNATSSATGAYAFSGLPAGNYYVRADPSASDGYVDQYSGGVFLKSQAVPVTVPVSGDVIVDFSLDPGNTIQGQITIQGTGTPAAQIDLDLFASNGEFIASVNAVTDATGNYTIGALPVGTFYLRADPDASQFLVERFYLNGNSVSTATPIQITGAGNLTGIDFQVEPGGIISGVVTDPGTGLPLAGFDMDLFTSTGSFVRYGAVTSSTGYYEIGAVPPGQYLVRVDPDPLTGYIRTYYFGALFEIDATPVTVAAGMVTTPVDIEVPLGGTLTGTITDSLTSLPLQGIDLDIFDAQGNRLPVTAKTDLTGFYRLGGLPAGSYTVRADPDPTSGYFTEYYDNTLFSASATLISVATGVETMNIDFALDSGGFIEGVILSQSGGTPIAGIDLDVFSASGTFLSSVDGVSSSTGYYRLGPIPPGTWVVQADSTVAQGYVDQYFNMQSTFSSATLVSINAGTTVSNVDFSLISGGTISGTIRASQGNQPLPNIDLDVFLTDGSRVNADARTDLTGFYQIGPLPPGQYVIRADPLNSTGYVDEYYMDATTVGTATPVTVNVGQDTSGIDFLLDGGPQSVTYWGLYE